MLMPYKLSLSLSFKKIVKVFLYKKKLFGKLFLKPTIPILPNKTDQTKPTLPNQTYQSKHTKPNLTNLTPNQTYQTKPSKLNLPKKTFLTKPIQTG